MHPSLFFWNCVSSSPFSNLPAIHGIAHMKQLFLVSPLTYWYPKYLLTPRKCLLLNYALLGTIEKNYYFKY